MQVLNYLKRQKNKVMPKGRKELLDVLYEGVDSYEIM
jgi:hypothetical protein